MEVTLFDNRTLQKAFLQDAIIAVLKSRVSPIRMNFKKDCIAFLSDVQDYVVHHDSHGLYPNYKSVSAAFKKYGVTDGEILVQAMDSKRIDLEAVGYPMKRLVTKDMQIEHVSRARTNFRSLGSLSYLGMDTRRTIVVRSKNGNFKPLFYEFHGKIKSNDPRLNEIKLDYHYATGCHYCDARPILLDTWLSLSEEEKYKTNID